MPEDRKDRIERLELEVHRLRAMLETVPDFVARITPEGTISFLNRRAPGFENVEVVGKSLFEFIPQEFRERVRDALRAAVETGEIQEYSAAGHVSASRMGHYLTRVRPFIENGTVTSLMLTSTDISSLEEHRVLLRLALESMGMGTFSFDPATGDGAWDDAACAVFGFAPGSPMPGMVRFAAEYLHPDDRDAVAKEFEKTLSSNAPFGPIEYRIRLDSGGTRWVSAAGTTLRDSRGGVVAIVGTVKDVTERRALEVRLREAEKLESIGRLAGGVAHDFNNMLTTILGNTAFAANAASVAEVAPLLEEIRLAAERSAALTAQLLAFARRQLVAPKLVPPDEAIRRLEPLLRRLLDERKKLELTLSAEGQVRIGESQLEQVVMNLVANARDAIAGAGIVRVETDDVTLDITASAALGLLAGSHWRLRVGDNGRGIPPEILPHLFEPFFTTREGGTGLGLATCYGIIKQNGGTICVDSELGRGSTFTVYLPRAERA